MISQKDSKQVSMDSWLLKLLSRHMKTKTKNKDQPANNKKKNNRKIKNNRLDGVGWNTPSKIK